MCVHNHNLGETNSLHMQKTSNVDEYQNHCTQPMRMNFVFANRAKILRNFCVLFDGIYEVFDEFGICKVYLIIISSIKYQNSGYI